MSQDKKLLVRGCPLCDIFLDSKPKTKLYWPEKIEDINNSEFIIVDCLTCKIPMVVYRDHVTTITKEAWGRILYRTRKMFGGGISLRCKPRKIFDHYHCHVTNIEKDKYASKTMSRRW